MINKKDYKHILESELQSLKINVTKFKKDIDTVDYQSLNNVELNAFLEKYFLELTFLFYKLNSILLKIKYKIHKNLHPSSKNLHERINSVFGKNNANNFYNLISYIKKHLSISSGGIEEYEIFFNIIETLIRHQVSHGFMRSIYYNLNNSNICYYYDYNHWVKYYEIEKNNSCFFILFCNQMIHEFDYLHLYGNGLLLNTVSGRIISQFNFFNIDLNLFDINNIEIIKDNFDISFRVNKLNYCWETDNFENHIAEIRARLDIKIEDKKLDEESINNMLVSYSDNNIIKNALNILQKQNDLNKLQKYISNINHKRCKKNFLFFSRS